MIYSDKVRIRSYLSWPDFKLGCIGIEHNDAVDTPPAHEHLDFYELVIVRSGTSKHFLNGRISEIHAGNVFLVKPKDKHTYIEPQHLAIYNLLFSRSFFHYFQPDITQMPGFQLIFNLHPKPAHPFEGIKIEDKYFSEIIRLADVMIGEQQDNNHENHGGKTALLISFLQIVLLLSRHAYWSSEGCKLSHIQAISRLVASLDKNYANNWTLMKMAKSVGMSVSGFRQEFKLLTGMPPIAYILNLRLEKSAILLHLPNISIGEVALRCGFSDSNYFTRQFKKRFGVTPRKVK
jgi:AraC family L-rhamnose operon regulatory protein RhaS